MWSAQCDEAVATLTMVFAPCMTDSPTLMRKAFSICSPLTGEPLDADINRAKIVLNSFASDMYLLYPTGLPAFMKQDKAANLLARRAIHWLKLMEPLQYVWAVTRKRPDRAKRSHIMDDMAGKAWYEHGQCPAVMHCKGTHDTFRDFAGAIRLQFKSTHYELQPGWEVYSATSLHQP
jgi:hypothetical protein